MKKAFTLAEVLIVLGIIGVIAAMTIPTLIKNIEHKELEVAFKKSYSELSQTIKLIQADIGTENLYDTYVFYDYKLGRYPMDLSWQQEFYKFMPYVKILDWGDVQYGWNYTHTALNSGNSAYYGMAKPLHLLKDGTLIDSIVTGWWDGRCIAIVIDTNGLKKPNRWGYDIFIFRVMGDNILRAWKSNGQTLPSNADIEKDHSLDWVGYPCTKKSNSPLNGIGCAGYALENVCPDDSTKTYWECLP